MLARSLRIESKIMEIYLNVNPDQTGMSEAKRTGLCTSGINIFKHVSEIFC